jgi:signal-transduction protein with cAMP-binding, CBS, and nucleotidyltransferase domain
VEQDRFREVEAMRIGEVLAGKASQEIITISPQATVRELLAKLAEHNIGAVIVCGDGSTLEGIVSERDVVRRLHEDEQALDAPVSTIMTSEVHACERSHPVVELMHMMTERRVRHVPVLDEGTLVGIVSIGDVVKSRMSELEFERDQLDSYVHSSQS